MKQLSEALNALDLSPDAKDVVAKILNQLDEKIINSFVENLKISNRKVGGTYYKDVKENLSSADFVSLYEALGYNFAQEIEWFNYRCEGGRRCIPSQGFTCNLDFCKPL